MTEFRDEWLDLPGAEILRSGLHDLSRGLETVPALLLRIAEPRLLRLGISCPGRSSAGSAGSGSGQDELALYRRLRAEVPDPYREYNALLRTLTSLCHALELRAARAARRGEG